MQQDFRSSNPSPSPETYTCMIRTQAICVSRARARERACACVTSRAVEIWQKLISHPEWWTKTSENGRKKSMMSLVWSAHLRFFSLMMMAAKIPEVVGLVKKSLAVLNYGMS